MVVLLLTFIAGFLTVLAPCILTLLPVIVGGGFRETADKKRPYIVAASLVVSLFIFTLLLKASTILITIDPMVWAVVSGCIIIALGLVMLFPDKWDSFVGKTGLQARSQRFLGKAGRVNNNTLSAILTGIALGPVFSSCSPTYAWVLASVLPENGLLGGMYLLVYCIGLAVALLLITLLGRRFIEKIKWAANPKSWFQRVVALLFITIGFLILFGFDKNIQTWFVERDILNLIEIEQSLVPEE